MMPKYVSKYDPIQNVWRIINVEHPVLKDMNPEEDIPEGSPAMNFVNGEEADSLVIEYKKRFPEKFEVIKINSSKDDNKWAKDLVVDIIKNSKDNEQLMTKTREFERMFRFIKL